ncbi:MAG: c-type cytochrome [Candidatus Acidiferrales bacterium]
MNLRLRALLAIVGLLLTGCGRKTGVVKSDPLAKAYDSEVDWNDPQRIIPLSYEQAQGKRIFYQQCVWCHADATPAGPSNRSNVTPSPPLMNDGSVLNAESDENIQNTIALGGSAVGKSAMMPPYGKVLSKEEIRSVITYIRAIAVPPYQPPANPASAYLEK